MIGMPIASKYRRIGPLPADAGPLGDRNVLAALDRQTAAGIADSGRVDTKPAL